MISVTNLRAGTIFEQDGQLFKVLSYEHIKMGRGSANIRVRVNNIRSGATLEKSFINGAKVNDVVVSKRNLQYLYKDSDNAFFMDPSSFEQISVLLNTIGDDKYFLKEGEKFDLSFLKDEALSVDLPPKMEFTVTETVPGVRGNSATNVFKEAVLENGMRVKVPLFIKEGNKIKVDTRTGSYSERA